MSNGSLSSWKTDTAIVLLGELPLQNLTSAKEKVEQYLSETGGWIPDDDSDPTGSGQPASGEDSAEAADSITEAEIARVYNTKVRADIKLDFHLVQNLDPDLSDEDVKTLIEETVQSFLVEQLGCTTTEFVELTDYEIENDRGGDTTAAQRVTADEEVKSGEKLIDPVSISLSYARDRFNLDDFWNVTYIYNEPTKDIVSLIERYTDPETYEDLDIFTLTQYAITMDASSYELASGVVTTRDE